MNTKIYQRLLVKQSIHLTMSLCFKQMLQRIAIVASEKICWIGHQLLQFAELNRIRTRPVIIQIGCLETFSSLRIYQHPLGLRFCNSTFHPGDLAPWQLQRWRSGAKEKLWGSESDWSGDTDLRAYRMDCYCTSMRLSTGNTQVWYYCTQRISDAECNKRLPANYLAQTEIQSPDGIAAYCTWHVAKHWSVGPKVGLKRLLAIQHRDLALKANSWGLSGSTPGYKTCDASPGGLNGKISLSSARMSIQWLFWDANGLVLACLSYAYYAWCSLKPHLRWHASRHGALGKWWDRHDEFGWVCTDTEDININGKYLHNWSQLYVYSIWWSYCWLQLKVMLAVMMVVVVVTVGTTWLSPHLMHL